MRLNRGQHFATICGTQSQGVAFEQDGKTFDSEGREIVIHRKKKVLPIEPMFPYLTHPEEIDPGHREGIDSMKRTLEGGGALPLIEVDEKMVVHSGFKRYNAYKELGYREIECYEIEIEKRG